MKDGGGNGAVLTKALRDLLESWEKTESAWKDRAREGFDKDFIQPLTHAVRAASKAAVQSEQFLRQIRNECSSS